MRVMIVMGNQELFCDMEDIEDNEYLDEDALPDVAPLDSSKSSSNE